MNFHDSGATDHIAPGYCECGCGEKTKIITSSNRARGLVKGQSYRYIHGHARGKNIRTMDYVEEDRGFETACWIWQGAIAVVGYGQAYVDGKTVYVHRLFYERTWGEVPAGHELHHLCGVRLCCNPTHVRPITRREHTRVGGRAKLCAWKVRAMRRAREEVGLTFKQLGAAFGVSDEQARKVINGESWEGV